MRYPTLSLMPLAAIAPNTATAPRSTAAGTTLCPTHLTRLGILVSLLVAAKCVRSECEVSLQGCASHSARSSVANCRPLLAHRALPTSPALARQ
jgi:hypothetical protein